MRRLVIYIGDSNRIRSFFRHPKRKQTKAIVEAQIQVRENWLNQITDLFSLNWGKAFSEKTILYNTKFQIESGIQDLNDKIEKLEFFCLTGIPVFQR